MYTLYNVILWQDCNFNFCEATCIQYWVLGPYYTLFDQPAMPIQPKVHSHWLNHAQGTVQGTHLEKLHRQLPVNPVVVCGKGQLTDQYNILLT